MKFSIQNLPCRGSGWKVEARRDAAPPAGHDCAWLRRRCVPTSPPSFPIATIRLWQWEDADLRRNTSTGGTQPGRRRAPTIPDLPYALLNRPILRCRPPVILVKKDAPAPPAAQSL